MIGFMPQVIRYSKNKAKVGSCIGASSESEITLDNSISGLALTYIRNKVVAHQKHIEHDHHDPIVRVLRRSESHIAG